MVLARCRAHVRAPRAVPFSRNNGHLTRLRPFTTSQHDHPHDEKKHTPKVIFSGIQPTGIPHLGNYLGALKQWHTLQATSPPTDTLIFSLVDLHAITVRQSPSALRAWRRESLATLLAVGLDPERCTLFYQSDVPQHAELMWILSCGAPVGNLARMTSWKSKLRVEESVMFEDTPLKLGLLSYPVLQAADVLVHRATHVPVGEDQAQHLEFTRTVAGGFNKSYGAVFPKVNTLLSPARRIKSLRNPTKKMSKSDPNPKSRILITDSRASIAAKIKAAVTDSHAGVTYDPDSRPELANLVNLAYHLGDESFTPQEFVSDCHNKSAFKEKLADYIDGKIAPMRARYEELMNPGREGELQRIGEEGGEKARRSAEETMVLVRERIGLR